MSCAGSPAAQAGIEAYDVVTAINGVALANSGDFAERISAIAPGTLISLTIFRNRQLMEIRLMLAAHECPDQRNGRSPA